MSHESSATASAAAAVRLVPARKDLLDIEAAAPGVRTFLDSMRHAGQDDPLDGPQAIIPGLLAEGQTAICAGPPGTGKSFAFLNWCAIIETGRDFLGQPVLQGGTVYVTGEGQGGLVRRISALATQMELTNDSAFLYVNVMPRMLEADQVSDFIAALKLPDGNDLRGHSSLHGNADVVCIFSASSIARLYGRITQAGPHGKLDDADPGDLLRHPKHRPCRRRRERKQRYRTAAGCRCPHQAERPAPAPSKSGSRRTARLAPYWVIR